MFRLKVSVRTVNSVIAIVSCQGLGNWINGWIGTGSVRQSLILAHVGFSVSFLLVERLVHLARQSSNTFAQSEFLPDLAS